MKAPRRSAAAGLAAGLVTVVAAVALLRPPANVPAPVPVSVPANAPAPAPAPANVPVPAPAPAPAKSAVDHERAVAPAPAAARKPAAARTRAVAQKPAVARKPDPRPLALRRFLALHPTERFAVWIDLDKRAAASTLLPAISARERARRAREGVGVLDTDHPIPPALLARLRRAGARIRVVATLIRSVSADVDSATAARLARLPEVVGLSPVGRMVSLALPAVAASPADAARAFAADTFYGFSYGPLQQLNIPAVHSLGYTGRGVRIGMLDSGFDRTHEALAPIRVAWQYDFIWGDTIVSNQALDTAAYNQAFHGTATLSILAGQKVGKLVGPAYDATLLLAKTEVSNNVGGGSGIDSHQDEDRWVAAADSLSLNQSVDIISSSLAYRYGFPDGDYPCSAMNGRTTKTSLEASQLARRHVLLVNAIGNEGPAACTLNAPADADSIIAVGAVDSLGSVTSFSSRGPTADGRTKPSLAARGQGVYFAVSGTTSQYARGNGTSFATPLIAGAAALVLQAWPNLPPMAVRQALVLSTNKRSPDNDVGYGVPDVASAILFPQGLGIGPVSPQDALNQLASVAPTFTWVAALVAPLQPIVYRLEIATDSMFQHTVYNDTISDALSLTPRMPLRPTNSLYWRVTATKGPAIRRQTSAAGPSVLPHWVRPLNLSDPAGTFTDSARPVLRWSALAVPPTLGPMRFDVQVLDLNDAPIPGETVTGITADSVKIPLALSFNGSYRWRVIARVKAAMDSDREVADTATSLGRFTVNSSESPPSTSLYQNFPNPFPRPDLGTASTRIWFDLSAAVPVELAIYDMRGRLVKRLIPADGCPAQTLGPGQFGRIPSGNSCVVTSWDGTDEKGRSLPRGVYLLRLRAGGVTQVRHIVYTP